MEGCVPTRVRLILVYAQTRGHWSMLLEVLMPLEVSMAVHVLMPAQVLMPVHVLMPVQVLMPVHVLMLVHVLMPRPQARDAGVNSGIVALSRPTRARARLSW